MTVIVEQLGPKTLLVRAGDATTMVDRSGQEGSVGFRSVDLLLASLGSCTVGSMLGAAERLGIEVSGVSIELKPVVTLTPERVSRIRMKMRIPDHLPEDQLTVLKAAAESCKVHNSLHFGIETSMELIEGSEIVYRD